MEKTISGPPPAGSAEDFEFVIQPVGMIDVYPALAVQPMPATTTVTVTGAGLATAFGTLTFTSSGVYAYEIQEVDWAAGTYINYIKDPTIYTLTVTVKTMPAYSQRLG